MKIISKFTDYYDNLQWVYGQDPLIIFDRRKKEGLPYYSDKYIETIDRIVTDMRADSFPKIGHQSHATLSYLGNILRPVKTSKGYLYRIPEVYEYLKKRGVTDEEIKDLSIIVRDIESEKEVEFFRKLKEEPLSFSDSELMETHIETRQPILVLTERGRDWTVEGIPNCLDFDLARVIPAEKAWKDITEFFSILNTMEEKDGDILENNDKISSHGFDTVRSFRPKIKK